MALVEILVLFGAPGSGKGTVAQFLKENYEVYHFSTGNLLRNEVKKESDIVNVTTARFSHLFG